MRHMLGNLSPNYFERTRRWLMMHPDGGWGSETLSLTAFAAPTLKTVTKKSKVTSCTVSFSPSQDLHGYDAPWPAGGGKNLLKNGIIPVTTTSQLTFDLAQPVKSETYTISFQSTTATSWRYYIKAFDSNGDLLGDGILTGQGMSYRSEYYGYLSGADTTATNIRITVSTDCYLAFALVLGDVSASTTVTDSQLELGSTATYFAPYSNICPISGWQGAEVTVDPKYGGDITWNQLADKVGATSHHMEDWASAITKNADGSVTVATTRDYSEMGFGFTTGKTYVGGHKYLLSITIKSCSFTPTNVGLFTTNAWSNIGQATMAYAGTKEYATIITTTANGDSGNVQRFNVRLIGTSLSGDSFTFTSAFCCDLTEMFGAGNEPSTVEEFRALFPLDYYAYNAGEVTNVSAVSGLPYSKTSVTFGQTVYGGTADIVAGTGSETMAEVDMGSLTWEATTLTTTRQAWATFDLAFKAPVDANHAINALCTIAKTVSYNDTWTPYVISNTSNNLGLVLCTEPNKYSDATELQTALNGVKLVYELATPTPYTFPPASDQLLLQKGDNYNWAEMTND